MTGMQVPIGVLYALLLSCTVSSQAAVGGSCTTNADCDDAIACTVDTCGVGGLCVHQPFAIFCPSDGLFCNGTESCNEIAGCISSGSPCQVGERCTEAEHCQPGIYSLLATTFGAGGAASTGGPIKQGVPLYGIASTTGLSGPIGRASSGPVIQNTLDTISDEASCEFFRANRETTTYLNMIARYGRPWLPDTNQSSAVDRDAPIENISSTLRSLASIVPVHLEAGFWPVEKATSSTATSDEYPSQFHEAALQELYSFEMLLGNEAFADAADPTVGGCDAQGVCPGDLGNLFAFEGVPGIGSLLAEELALLRGREIALPALGQPFEDTTTPFGSYPEYSDAGGSVRAAVYNRLPPHEENPAYLASYGVNSSADAVRSKFPQGHGDAYGYYLSATKTYLSAFRGNPADFGTGMDVAGADLVAQRFIDGQAGDLESIDPGGSGGNDEVVVPYMAVRNLAVAAAARARTAVRVVDLTFRRDFSENVEQQDLTEFGEAGDAGQRAWKMGDWAKRGALGAYLDWAVVNQLLPPAPFCDAGGCSGGPLNGAECEFDFDCVTDELGEVHRFSIEEVGEVGAAVGEMQERLDAAGAGLNPLGLVQNVVPFGLQAELLGTATGKSHYRQVRDAAAIALSNARNILTWANQSTQRLSQQDEQLETVSEQIEDREADFENRLIEVFGYPSPDDPSDNDFDPTTDDAEEAASNADLVNFLLDDQALADRGWGTRAAPGEIQLAMSELRIAELRGDEADLALAELEAQIDDQLKRIELITQTAAAEIQIINSAGEQFMALTERLKQIKTRCNFWCKMKKGLAVVGAVAAGVVACVGTAGGGCAAGALATAAIITSTVATATSAAIDAFDATGSYKAFKSEFDIQKEKERVQTWKEAQLAGIRNQERLGLEKIELEALIRKTPQYMVNLAIAAEGAAQAMGRLNASVQRGNRLVQERERIRKLQRDDLAEYRWKDLAFRVFRNNALQQYASFYDFAARWVFLSARAFAYEWNDRVCADPLIDALYHTRSLGDCVGSPNCTGIGGLYGILTDLDACDVNNAFNQPASPAGTETFSFRRHLLCLGARGSGLPGSTKPFFVDPTSDEFETIDHGFLTRDAVVVSSSNSLPAGLSNENEYYVRVVDANTYTLHRRPADAAANTLKIDVTGFGVGSHSVALSPNRQFRAWMESHIVQRLEELPLMRSYAQLDPPSELGGTAGRDRGPAIVITFFTESTNANIFGNGPSQQCGIDRFELTENVKIRNYWLKFEGVDACAGLGLCSPEGSFDVFFFPYGASVLKERNNGPFIGEPRHWYVVDQWLPLPPTFTDIDSGFEDRSYNLWRESGDTFDNFLNSIKRFNESRAQVEIQQPIEKRPDLAGRSVWNTQWVLVIPGGVFDNSSDTARRNALMRFIYGLNGNPQDNVGITDIRWGIEAYKN